MTAAPDSRLADLLAGILANPKDDTPRRSTRRLTESAYSTTSTGSGTCGEPVSVTPTPVGPFVGPISR